LTLTCGKLSDPTERSCLSHRFTYGGSTGGWEALAVQIMYPDDFNGCFAACPDSISFEAYATMNIYEDSNAYWCEHNALFVRTLST
jgi:hypothetical protein